MNTKLLKKIRKRYQWKWYNGKWVILDHKKEEAMFKMDARSFVYYYAGKHLGFSIAANYYERLKHRDANKEYKYWERIFEIFLILLLVPVLSFSQQHYQDYPPNKVKDSLETLHGKLTIERDLLMDKIDSLENKIQYLAFTIRQMNGEAKPRIYVQYHSTAIKIAEAIRKEGFLVRILQHPSKPGFNIVTYEK